MIESKENQEPKSENIGIYDGGEWIITAASWTSVGWTSYEIGIRHKKTGKFYMIQNNFDYIEVQNVANAIAHLLCLETENYSPEWAKSWFIRGE